MGCGTTDVSRLRIGGDLFYKTFDVSEGRKHEIFPLQRKQCTYCRDLFQPLIGSRHGHDKSGRILTYTTEFPLAPKTHLLSRGPAPLSVYTNFCEITL
ncbi:hypothetical protein XELAEV_18024346mg [Xenopus laevis]|uniref:Uncharacterized protein n=1 Tax=Xenopus laevis TaxID=8355 RepID=A0A974CXM0_XENLA|nr:hypothetical protein XELAEV_18024346mg [Xenopus laevis]